MEKETASVIFGKDSELRFPHFALLKASAGSGKTHALTMRFVQFLLSAKVPHNALRNIMAVTFSNNAAKEMRERILGWLKAVALGEKDKITEVSRTVSLQEGRLREKAEEMIELILDNYSDFQVRTIDSFLASVFRASAIDFGYTPEFDILFGKDQIMKYAFDLYLKNVSEGTPVARLMEEMAWMAVEAKKGDAGFLWDPSEQLLDEVKKLHGRLLALSSDPVVEDLSPRMAILKNRMKDIVAGIEETIERSGLERNRSSSYARSDFPRIMEENRQRDLLGKSLKTPPVKKEKGKQSECHKRVLALWEELGSMLAEYASCYARSWYYPSFRICRDIGRILEGVKRAQGKIFIDDINRYLAGYLRHELVPDVYFRLGETVYHYLIDEFQDTSPLQWNNLRPLLENSLSQGGSLFVVGDTKQAVYGFRDADYRIMKGLETNNPFLSAKHGTKELRTNYRSGKRILDLNEAVFHRKVPAEERYAEAGSRSGLTDYVQFPLEGRENDGYAQIVILDRDSEHEPEKDMIQKTVEDLASRGFRYSDIAVLTQKNEDAVTVTGWLNEKGIEFLSFSSLDVRRRKVAGEIIAVLNFLDSPVDDHSFTTVILGDLFGELLEREVGGRDAEDMREFIFRHRDRHPLYTAFRKEFPDLWDKCFQVLFRAAGYLPVYDLVTAIYAGFNVFEAFPEDEAAFVKILEVIKEFEGAGYNSLRDFLDHADDEDSDGSMWNIDVPRDLEAVRVMTIHKAKGLGFPAVIVLLYAARSRGLDHIVTELDGEYTLLKLTREICASNPDFEVLYNEEQTSDLVNSMNALYVGLTRAKEELHVIGVRGVQDRYPFDILPEDEFGPSERIARGEDDHGKRLRICATGHRPGGPGFAREGETVLPGKEAKRGEFVHDVLSRIQYTGDDIDTELKDIIRDVSIVTGREYDLPLMEDIIRGLVEREGIGEYFRQKEDRQVMTEQEFSDRGGRLYRMDRVVVDPGRVTVLDFKTGREGKSERYDRQMRTYMAILAEIYAGRAVEGIIAYTDTDEVRMIR